MSTDDEREERDEETRVTSITMRPLPTGALARLYEEQGLRDRAVATWRAVLAASPADMDAVNALRALGEVVVVDDDGYADGARTIEPSGELPMGYGIDEVVALPVDATTVLVYWETTETGITRARAAGGAGPIVVRVVSTWLDAAGTPTQQTHESVVGATMGEVFVEGLPAGAVHVCAVGLVRADESLVPIAHAGPAATPSA